MKENKFLKSLLASLLAFSAVASSATPVFAEDTAAEPEEAVLEEAPAEAEDLPAEEETVEDQAVEEEKTVSFYEKLDDVTVSAEAAANVFPAGTVMTVKKVDDEATLALAAQAVGENATTKVAVDITFICGNDEIQPNGEVRVTISSPEIAELDNPVLVHVDDKQEEVTPEVVEQIEEPTPAEEVTADLDSFSVYAVVDEGQQGDDNARVAVHFMSGTTEVATYYVKNDDDEEMIEKIVSDPGIGSYSQEDNVIFRGWYISNSATADYTTKTEGVTIEEVRAKLLEMANADSIKEGDNLYVHAVLLKYFDITYYGDDTNVSLGTHTVTALLTDNDAEYEVNMAYTADGDQNFEGWKVTAGGQYIEGHQDPETLYANGTKIKVSGNVTFSVYAPHGAWLIFHENNGTYVAPEFIKTGESTEEPTVEMRRLGYTFGGWYYDNNTFTRAFTFGQPLTDTTDIYAKWTPVATASYTVIFWQQKVDGSDWDFLDSVTLTGNVGSTISVSSNSNNRINIAVGGTTVHTYQYKDGFSFGDADSGKTITPEGNTVVNVHINRNKYTLTFQVYRSSGWSGQWVTVKTIEAYYEQNIADNFPIAGYENDRWAPQGDSQWKEVMVLIDTMPSRNVTFHRNTADYPAKTMNYYVEALPGETGTKEYNGKQFNLYKGLTPNYNGVTVEDYLDLTGYSKYAVADQDGHTLTPSGNPAFYSYNGTKATTVNFYYLRDVYKLNYLDGTYFDGYENIQDIESAGQWNVIENITYGAHLTAKNKGGSEYYIPTGEKVREGYVFDGWYADNRCTTPYVFTDMPQGGITVYAKWHQVQYRVFLHPNVNSADTSLNWGSEDVSTSFRVSHGEKISAPTGQRSDYEFIAWYTDEACTQLFDDDAYVLNDTTVTTEYDKTLPTERDKYGQPTDSVNKDVNRYWITRQFDLYAKWRAKLTGAQGIGIIYDANGGTNAPEDHRLYLDSAGAIAQAASTPPAEKRFLYWVVQKWNGSAYEDTAVKVYPGDTFTVYKADAREQDITDGTQTEDVYKTYTVQLRAEYGEVKPYEPTHIYWYSNFLNASDVHAYEKENTIPGKEGKHEYFQINEAVLIKPADTFKRDGYIFLGWAKVNAPADEANAPVQNLTEANLYLKYMNDKFYIKDTQGNWTVEVSKVAADENRPYQDMYAVWMKTFEIDHSSSAKGVDVDAYTANGYKVVDGKMTNEVGDIVKKDAAGKPILDNNGVATFDLTKAVRDDYFYGGYYSARPAEKYEGGRGLWDQGNAYTEYGTQFKPGDESVYYLKEVPVRYLQPYTQYVYNKSYDNVVCGLYMITAVDDNNYDKIGTLAYKGTDEANYAIYEPFKFTMKYTLKPVTGTNSTILNAKTVLGAASDVNSPIAVWNVTEMINEGVFDVFATPSDRPPVNGLKSGKKINLAPYVLTPDHIGVSMCYREFTTTSTSTVRPEFTYRSDLTNPANRVNETYDKTVWYQEVKNN